MTAFGALVGVTLRGLLGRRRTLLMVLLAALPVLVGHPCAAFQQQMSAKKKGEAP